MGRSEFPTKGPYWRPQRIVILLLEAKIRDPYPKNSIIHKHKVAGPASSTRAGDAQVNVLAKAFIAGINGYNTVQGLGPHRGHVDNLGE